MAASGTVNIRTAEGDVLQANLYADGHAGETTPSLHIRDASGVELKAGLVATADNDPRKALVVHEEIDPITGEKTITKHRVNGRANSSTQYTLLSQLEGGIATGDQVVTGNVAAAHHRFIHDNFDTETTTKDDVSRLYHLQLAGCKLNFQRLDDTSYVDYCVYYRVDGVDHVWLDWSDLVDRSLHTMTFPLMSGSHTIGWKVQSFKTGLFTYRAEAALSIDSIACVDNTGE